MAYITHDITCGLTIDCAAHASEYPFEIEAQRGYGHAWVLSLAEARALRNWLTRRLGEQDAMNGHSA